MTSFLIMNNMPPTTSTYRKIETEMVTTHPDRFISIRGGSKTTMTLALSYDKAHQLHRELGEVLEEISKTPSATKPRE